MLKSSTVAQAAMEVVELNVGGIHYATTRSTLCKHSTSMLARMFSGDVPPAHQDRKGRFFIDRNGELFGIIISYLREERFSMPTDKIKLKALAEEASFFQVRDMPVISVAPYVIRHTRYVPHDT